jgi:two-component system, cell cycle sensor histidine kinase and response regulator CckA
MALRNRPSALLQHRPREIQSVHLGSVIDDVVYVLSRVLPQSIMVKTAVAGSLPPVAAVDSEMAFMLMNLCIRARDAMPAGGVLTISAENLCDSQSTAILPGRPLDPHLHLTIAHTASPVLPHPDSDHPAPWHSLPPHLKKPEEELDRARSIVRKYRGILEISNQSDGGSRVDIFLPASFAGGPGNRRARQPRLLIADANPHLQQEYEQSCLSHGIQLESCRSGVECLEKLATTTPDALIVDLDLPWGGGDGVVACLHAETSDRPHPLVFATGSHPAEAVARRIGIPVQHCFAKPIPSGELVARVCDLLSVAPPLVPARSQGS